MDRFTICSLTHNSLQAIFQTIITNNAKIECSVELGAGRPLSKFCEVVYETGFDSALCCRSL